MCPKFAYGDVYPGMLPPFTATTIACSEEVPLVVVPLNFSWLSECSSFSSRPGDEGKDMAVIQGRKKRAASS